MLLCAFRLMVWNKAKCVYDSRLAFLLGRHTTLIWLIITDVLADPHCMRGDTPSIYVSAMLQLYMQSSFGPKKHRNPVRHTGQ